MFRKQKIYIKNRAKSMQQTTGIKIGWGKTPIMSYPRVSMNPT